MEGRALTSNIRRPVSVPFTESESTIRLFVAVPRRTAKGSGDLTLVRTNGAIMRGRFDEWPLLCVLGELYAYNKIDR